MKRWKLGVFASLVVGVLGCEATAPHETEIAQGLGDPCSVQMPLIKVWTGSQPPPPGNGKMYIIYAPLNGYSLAALVDYQNTAIPYATMVPVGKRNTFIAATQVSLAGYVVIGGGPPVPPDVTPELTAARIVFEAQRYAMVPGLAAADTMSCGGPNGPGPIGPGPGPIGPGPIKGF